MVKQFESRGKFIHNNQEANQVLVEVAVDLAVEEAEAVEVEAAVVVAV